MRPACSCRSFGLPSSRSPTWPIAQSSPAIAFLTNFSAIISSRRIFLTGSSKSAALRTASVNSFSLARPAGLPDCPFTNGIASNPNCCVGHNIYAIRDKTVQLIYHTYIRRPRRERPEKLRIQRIFQSSQLCSLIAHHAEHEIKRQLARSRNLCPDRGLPFAIPLLL